MRCCTSVLHLIFCHWSLVEGRQMRLAFALEQKRSLRLCFPLREPAARVPGPGRFSSPGYRCLHTPAGCGTAVFHQVFGELVRLAVVPYGKIRDVLVDAFPESRQQHIHIFVPTQKRLPLTGDSRFSGFISFLLFPSSPRCSGYGVPAAAFRPLHWVPDTSGRWRSGISGKRLRHGWTAVWP